MRERIWRLALLGPEITIGPKLGLMREHVERGERDTQSLFFDVVSSKLKPAHLLRSVVG
jgi:hypothetical protein